MCAFGERGKELAAMNVGSPVHTKYNINKNGEKYEKYYIILYNCHMSSSSSSIAKLLIFLFILFETLFILAADGSIVEDGIMSSSPLQ